MKGYDTELYTQVFSQLKSGKALAFNIETSRAFPDIPSSLLDGNQSHALAVIGNKFIDGKCYLKVQNSWGESWQNQHNNGWLDAEVFLQATQDVTWIEEKL